jgi:hypothetical protein
MHSLCLSNCHTNSLFNYFRSWDVQSLYELLVRALELLWKESNSDISDTLILHEVVLEKLQINVNKKILEYISN